MDRLVVQELCENCNLGTRLSQADSERLAVWPEAECLLLHYRNKRNKLRKKQKKIEKQTSHALKQLEKFINSILFKKKI